MKLTQLRLHERKRWILGWLLYVNKVALDCNTIKREKVFWVKEWSKIMRFCWFYMRFLLSILKNVNLWFENLNLKNTLILNHLIFSLKKSVINEKFNIKREFHAPIYTFTLLFMHIYIRQSGQMLFNNLAENSQWRCAFNCAANNHLMFTYNLKPTFYYSINPITSK